MAYLDYHLHILGELVVDYPLPQKTLLTQLVYVGARTDTTCWCSYTTVA